MIDLGRLRALHAVAVHGSINAAAAALGYTPSAVSQQIAKLERETRTTLLERRGRGVVLTDAARSLAGTAHSVLALVEQAEIRLEQLRGAAVGRVRLGAFATACRGLLPPAVAALAAEQAELDLRVLEVDPPSAVEMVSRGELDVAVVHDWTNTPLAVDESLARHPLGEDHADVLVPAGHRLAEQSSVQPEDLVGERWICQPAGSICHDWLVRTMREARVEPIVAHEITEYQTQLEFLALGQGIALLPRLGRAALPPTVRALRLRPVPTRRLFAVWRERASRRPAIAVTVQALVRTWDKVVQTT
ncbi:LysR family transcriptional regulator [Kutzneria albida]|uniref:LysR family transcription regulator n=1 Tax=Kutzneria albida DSM 43870 TaxID=1449976 RepID=W5WE52_9PSEU|nr:LysR family transcriptional regulator [Kutzneria albida]AHH96454.1 LysR family transcription regulator [Kutzneria albida DSM 43870]